MDTVNLPGRGTTFVRDLAGPPGAPVVVLLHGLAATADLNWSGCYATLGAHFRVVALDNRGHGRGIRARGRFRLADCADDVAAVADVLGLRTFVVVGYSMGGPIAQLVWHRHPDRVDGLVLCATSRNFRGHPRERLMFERAGRGRPRRAPDAAGGVAPAGHGGEPADRGLRGSAVEVVRVPTQRPDGADRGGPGARPLHVARLDQ